MYSNGGLGQGLVILEKKKSKTQKPGLGLQKLSLLHDAAWIVIRVKWLLYTFVVPGCYLISHDLPGYVFQLCLELSSFWLGTQTASISLQSAILFYKNAACLISTIKSLPRAILPLISRHNQAASFLLNCAVIHLLHSIFNTNFAGLSWIVGDNTSGTKHSRILQKYMHTYIHT